MNLTLRVLMTPSGFLKICETVFTIIMVCVGQTKVDDYGSSTRDFVVGGTFILCLSVTPLLLISYVLGHNQIQKTMFEMAVNLYMGVLMITSGCLILNTYIDKPVYRDSSNRDAALAMGSFGIFNCVFYFLDTFFAYKNFTD